MNGYRKMISDNIPDTWNLALKWRKCKLKWIDYVYSKHVKPYDTNCMTSKSENKRKKTQAVKNLLKKDAKFCDSIKWDCFLLHPTKENTEAYVFWQNVNQWVNWFCKTRKYINECIETRKQYDETDAEIAEFVNAHFSLGNMKLSLFIVKNYKSC